MSFGVRLTAQNKSNGTLTLDDGQTASFSSSSSPLPFRARGRNYDTFPKEKGAQGRPHAPVSTSSYNNSLTLAITAKASATYSTSALPCAQPQLAFMLMARRSLTKRHPTT